MMDDFENMKMGDLEDMWDDLDKKVMDELKNMNDRY